MVPRLRRAECFPRRAKCRNAQSMRQCDALIPTEVCCVNDVRIGGRFHRTHDLRSMMAMSAMRLPCSSSSILGKIHALLQIYRVEARCPHFEPHHLKVGLASAPRSTRGEPAESGGAAPLWKLKDQRTSPDDIWRWHAYIVSRPTSALWLR